MQIKHNEEPMLAFQLKWFLKTISKKNTGINNRNKALISDQ
jgi:hypothetical protein